MEFETTEDLTEADIQEILDRFNMFRERNNLERYISATVFYKDGLYKVDGTFKKIYRID